MYIVNVEAAIYKGDKWLIIKRSKKETHAGGLFSLVGGKVEFRENSKDILEKTIKREILEEVGIHVKENIEYVHSTTFITDLGEPVVDIVFLCEYDKGYATAKNEGEVECVYWLSYDEIINNPLTPFYLKDSMIQAKSLIQTKFVSIH